MKLYRCRVCKWEAISKEDMLSHLSAEHPNLLSYTDSEQLIENTCDDTDNETIIDIITQGTEDLNYDAGGGGALVIPDGEGHKKKYPYPFPPIYSTGKTFLYEECQVKGDANQMFSHIIKVHPAMTKHFLQKYCEERILNHRKTQMPSSEALNAEQVRKWAEKDVQDILYKLELEADGKDQLADFLSNTSYPELRKFIEGKRQSCPYCGLSSGVLGITDLQGKYYQEKAIAGIKQSNPELNNLSLNQISTMKFKAMWDLEPISTPFLEMLHLSVKHYPQMVELLSSQILKSDLALWLASLRTTPEKQELMITKTATVRDRLSKEALDFLKGLTPTKFVKTQYVK